MVWFEEIVEDEGEDEDCCDGEGGEFGCCYCWWW